MITAASGPAVPGPPVLGCPRSDPSRLLVTRERSEGFPGLCCSRVSPERHCTGFPEGAMRYILRRPRAFWISMCNLLGILCSLVGVVLLLLFALPPEVPGAGTGLTADN